MTNRNPMKQWVRVLVWAMLVCAAPALAERDSFYLGTGRDGALGVSGTKIINSYQVVSGPLAPGDTSISVSGATAGDARGFLTGDLVMVLQTTGFIPIPPAGQASKDLSADPVGRWEFARLTNVSATTLTLTAPLIYSYAASVTQVIRVPEYTTVTLNAGTSIVPVPWNGSLGGVVAFLATGAVTNNGSIRATGSGFRGGTYDPATDTDSTATLTCSGVDQPSPQGGHKGEGIVNLKYGATSAGLGAYYNGGGGGVCLQSGGGGGGNGGQGGVGGNTDASDGARSVGGQGGSALGYGTTLNHLTLGGGGGVGHSQDGNATSGGAGGGIVFIRADIISGTGSIQSVGQSAASAGTDAASGGGAGGTIYIRLAGPAACAASSSAGGGVGGNTGGFQVGPGGGGGGGQVVFQACDRGATTVTCSITRSGGSAGSQQDSSNANYGAVKGNTGALYPIPNCFTIPTASISVTTPVNNSFTNNRRPAIAGTGPASNLIVVYVDGVEIGTTTSNASGNWSFTPTIDLAIGLRQISAAAEFTGVVTARSTANNVTIDVTPPAQPTVSTPTDGTLTNNNRIPIGGNAEANSRVDVYVDGVKVGSTTANASGSFTYTPGATDLPDGARKVKVTATDAAGNTSVFSNEITINVDTLPPPAPILSAPGNGSYTNNTFPVYSGTAEANSTVTVILVDPVLGTVTLGNAPVSLAGVWTLNSPSSLDDGVYQVRAFAKDAAGNQSVNSNTNTFTVDTFKPAVPVIAAPLSGSSSNNPLPTISGTAEPLSTVTLYLDGSNTPVATVSTNAAGVWSYPYNGTPLTDGSHSVRAEAADRAGNVSPRSLSTSFTVDTTPPAKPVVTFPADQQTINNRTPTFRGTAEALSIVEVVVDSVSLPFVVADSAGNWSAASNLPPLAEGSSHTVKARATDGVGNTGAFSSVNTFFVDITPPAKPTVLTPANGSVTKSRQPLVTGTAEANSAVTITFDKGTAGELSATTSADGNGSFSLVPLFAFAPGTSTHTVSAVARDAGGNNSPTSDTNVFVIDTDPPSAPVVLTPSNGSTIYTERPLVMGTAEAGSRVEVFVDGVSVGFATAASDGTWSVPVGVDLTNGQRAVTATATDPAGNTSAESLPVFITVDLTPPNTTITDHPVTLTNQSTAAFKFTSSKPQSTFECSLDSAPFTTCSTPLTLNGLAEQSHTLRVRAIDAGRHVDPSPDAFTWKVDLTAPSAPSITRPVAGALVTPTPVITGTAEANSTVTVYVDNRPPETVTADANGAWSFTPQTPLSESGHTVRATSTDPAGNLGPTSAPVSFSVDTLPPVTQLTRTPESASNSADATFEFTSEAGATFECRLDGGAYTACTSPFTVPNLPGGSHTFEVRARDAAGNVQATPTTFTWTVNRTHESRFAGGGLGGCSAAGGGSNLALLSVLGLLAHAVARRRTR